MIAGILIAVGLILFVVAMCMNGWDFTKLGTISYETNLHELSADFQNISIQTDTARIYFALSEDGTCRVVCREAVKQKHTVTVENDALMIAVQDERAWYERIGFSFDSPYITVYLPKNMYDSLSVRTATGDVSIAKDFSFENVDVSVSTGDVRAYASAKTMKAKTSTGDIYVEGVTVDVLEVSVSTGDVEVLDTICKNDIYVGVSTGGMTLTNVHCGSLSSTGSTGGVSMRNVIAQTAFSIERTTGDISFEQCDAAEIYIKTSTGSVKGILLSGKMFSASTGTGSVSVPDSTVGNGECKIVTSTGNIKIVVD